jgi:hypothetical protein
MARALASAAGVEARSRFSLEGVRAGVEAVIDESIRVRRRGA